MRAGGEGAGREHAAPEAFGEEGPVAVAGAGFGDEARDAGLHGFLPRADGGTPPEPAPEAHIAGGGLLLEGGDAGDGEPGEDGGGGGGDRGGEPLGDAQAVLVDGVVGGRAGGFVAQEGGPSGADAPGGGRLERAEAGGGEAGGEAGGAAEQDEGRLGGGAEGAEEDEGGAQVGSGVAAAEGGGKGRGEVAVEDLGGAGAILAEGGHGGFALGGDAEPAFDLGVVDDGRDGLEQHGVAGVHGSVAGGVGLVGVDPADGGALLRGDPVLEDQRPGAVAEPVHGGLDGREIGMGGEREPLLVGDVLAAEEGVEPGRGVERLAELVEAGEIARGLEVPEIRADAVDGIGGAADQAGVLVGPGAVGGAVDGGAGVGGAGVGGHGRWGGAGRRRRRMMGRV